MHMDPIAARRTQAGAPVVHGMHEALWAVDALVAHGAIDKPITTLAVQFRRFVYVGAEVSLRLVRSTERSLRAELIADGLSATTLDVGFGAATAPEVIDVGHSGVEFSAESLVEPLGLDFSALSDRSGVVSHVPGAAAAHLFPHAAGRLGNSALRSLVRLSALVGMICPGLYSIFGGFKISVFPSRESSGRVKFSVRSVDERFRMVTIAIDGGVVAGTVEAFVRKPPMTPPRVADLADVVRGDEFAGTTALIVGGSRGLGALTARLIAAGGGRIVVTYVTGEREARALADELSTDRCRVLRYDARDDAASQLADLVWNVDQLYYFATTPIFRAKAAWWVPERFAEFCRVYVDGFAGVCTAVRARAAENLTVFYPSSVAVDERPRGMAEYSAAKVAGEILCAEMNRALHGVHVLVRRLPRIETDQTATIMPVQSADGLEVMLPIVREMHAKPSPAPLGS